MKFVSSSVKIDKRVLEKLSKAAISAQEMTTSALKTEESIDQVMPRDTGNMSVKHTFVDFSKAKNGETDIITSTPYARKLYFHPEYNFQRFEHKNAQGKWHANYISGPKKDFCKKAFTKFYRKVAGV